MNRTVEVFCAELVGYEQLTFFSRKQNEPGCKFIYRTEAEGYALLQELREAFFGKVGEGIEKRFLKAFQRLNGEFDKLAVRSEPADIEVYIGKTFLHFRDTKTGRGTSVNRARHFE